MKNIFIKPIFLSILSLGILSSCVNDNDYAIPKTLDKVYFSEDFPYTEISTGDNLDFEGWTNFAEAGSKLWTEGQFKEDGYIQFNPYKSNDASNIGWAITPAIDLNGSSSYYLSFSSASNFVNNKDNRLEVYVSSNYDGSNVLAATWTKLSARVADKDSNPEKSYTYVPSGEVNLSTYAGKTVHIAFRAIGNSSTLTGLFQVDKVIVYSLN
jgi:hypothetical protein